MYGDSLHLVIIDLVLVWDNEVSCEGSLYHNSDLLWWYQDSKIQHLQISSAFEVFLLKDCLFKIHSRMIWNVLVSWCSCSWYQFCCTFCQCILLTSLFLLQYSRRKRFFFWKWGDKPCLNAYFLIFNFKTLTVARVRWFSIGMYVCFTFPSTAILKTLTLIQRRWNPNQWLLVPITCLKLAVVSF